MYCYPQIRIANGTTSNRTFNIQLELGPTATAYAPYTGDQISVTFPSSAGDSGTIYGGTPVSRTNVNCVIAYNHSYAAGAITDGKKVVNCTYYGNVCDIGNNANSAIIRDVDLDPIGFKINLEVLTKAHYKTVTEVPFTFVDRYAGKSKFNGGEIKAYLIHLCRLFAYWIRVRPQRKRIKYTKCPEPVEQD